MQIAITGATGFIGAHLASSLDAIGVGYRVLTRDPDRARLKLPGASDVIHWDPPHAGLDPSKLEGLDAVVHLAGAPVAQRWTRKARQEIYGSRVLSTRLLTECIAQLDAPPSVVVSGSALGIYGPRDDTLLNEGSSEGIDYLAGVCRDWEAAARPLSGQGIRVVHPRIGIVLGPDGGALSLMLTPFRLGVGGPIGHGRQWMSWIHVEDVIELILYAIRTASIVGPLNLTAPNPVRNKEFARELGRVLRRPALLPTPVIALKLLYGGFADILATGQRVLPEKAVSSGYTFRFPDLQGALVNLLGQVPN